MLRITVELVPYGDESQKSTLSQFEVVNNKHLHDTIYQYIVRESKEYPDPIVAFVHDRSDGLNDCLRLAFGRLCIAGLDKI